MSEARAPWWERRSTVLIVLLAVMLPYAWWQVPPLTDVPAHMGRYRIALDLAHSASLQRFYDFHWSLLPNLGVDLLMVPLGRLLGVELGTRLVIVLIPALLLVGFLWSAKEAHGRLPPTWPFAVPLVFSYPFLYGFLNFALSAALAFLALALWLRLGRTGRTGLRAGLFVPLAFIVWITHVFGWGMLGLLVFGCEWARARGEGHNWWRAAVKAALYCLPLAGPALLMVAWQGQSTAGADDWFNLSWKLTSLFTVLRDRWMLVDLGFLAVMLLLLVAGLRDRRLSFEPKLITAAALLFAAFILLPRLLLGGAHSDDRLAPYFLAAALLAVRPSAEASPRLVSGLAMAGILFLAVRLAAVTLSAGLYDRSFREQLAALDHVPQGARVLSFVGMYCRPDWAARRFEHLPSLVIVRREGFANDQWTVAGSHLLSLRAPYSRYVDPSQMVSRGDCDGVPVEAAIASSDLTLFDYVWMIDPPAYDAALTRGWTPVWRHGTSALFRLPPAAGVTLP